MTEATAINQISLLQSIQKRRLDKKVNDIKEQQKVIAERTLTYEESKSNHDNFKKMNENIEYDLMTGLLKKKIQKMDAAELPLRIEKALKEIARMEEQVKQKHDKLITEQQNFDLLGLEKKSLESRNEAYSLLAKDMANTSLIEEARKEEAIIDEFVESKSWTVER